MSLTSLDLYYLSRERQLKVSYPGKLDGKIRSGQATAALETLKIMEKLKEMKIMYDACQANRIFFSKSEAIIACNKIHSMAVESLKVFAGAFEKIPNKPDETVYEVSQFDVCDMAVTRRFMSNVFVNYLLFTEDSEFSFDVLEMLIGMKLEFPGPKPLEPKKEKDANGRDITPQIKQDEASVEYFFRKITGNAQGHLIRPKYAERWYSFKNYISELRKYVRGDFSGLDRLVSDIPDMPYLLDSFTGFKNLFQIPEVTAAYANINMLAAQFNGTFAQLESGFAALESSCAQQ